eukprot:CAMPEP_0177389144 /NCGR_PEP_ID=MMETSP0368-20130122/52379_1 /TAXON_ID=447022 ORGANISM="Scrippsiella hangoei-like, Strain SHHI-4" /NCGR_SAMPLE_ID=MMETSP0368 /ASSEMBLY_ACC=CAM_ASM_000363 /LENGTH=60 /DNA_ID=CAMNT_0018854477 /DNA_START=96 /DNA_END=275 /DNA_ORIENTATION=+
MSVHVALLDQAVLDGIVALHPPLLADHRHRGGGGVLEPVAGTNDDDEDGDEVAPAIARAA